MAPRTSGIMAIPAAPLAHAPVAAAVVLSVAEVSWSLLVGKACGGWAHVVREPLLRCCGFYAVICSGVELEGLGTGGATVL